MCKSVNNTELPIQMLDDDPPPRYSSDRAALVDDKVHWRKIADDPPANGAKVQLINRKAGVAHYGVYSTSDTFYDYWAPLPVFKDEREDKMT